MRSDEESAEDERERLKGEKKKSKERQRKELHKYKKRLKKYGEKARPLAVKKIKTQRKALSCELHGESVRTVVEMSALVSGEVAELLVGVGLELMIGVKAGPFNLDMFHAATNTVIEVCPEWQFYVSDIEWSTRCAGDGIDIVNKFC